LTGGPTLGVSGGEVRGRQPQEGTTMITTNRTLRRAGAGVALAVALARAVSG